jgi:tetratricopeptide (TPR) repeat protein
MQSFRSTIILVAALLFITSTAFAQGRGRIDGRVVGPDGQPLAGVAVTAAKVGAEERAVATSNAKGEFRLERLSNGQWELGFAFEGLEVAPAVVTVEGNKPREITVTMAPPDPMVEINNKLREAADKAQVGDLAGARAIYEQLHAKYPQPFQFPYAIATTYTAEKDFEKGLEFAKIAAERDPSSADVKLLMAEIYMSTDRAAEARTILDGIDLKEIDDPVLFINQGIIQINAGEHDEAIALFDRLLERFPTTHQIMYYRGRAQVAAERLPEAKADLEKFIAAAPPTAPEVEAAKKLIEEINKVLAGKKDGKEVL